MVSTPKSGWGKIQNDSTARFRVNTQLPGGQFAFPVTGPTAEARGFAIMPDANPTQEVVDRVAAKFQAFYDGLPAEEQVVVTALLAQAAELTEQAWPA